MRLAARVCAVTGALVVPAVASAAFLTDIAGQVGSEAGASTSISVISDWRVNCRIRDGDRRCRMETAATGTSPEGEAIPLSLSGEATGAGRPLFFLTTPLDLLVANGIEMRVDTGPSMRLAYRSCHAAGCLAPFQLSPELEAGFRRGTTLRVRLFDLEARPIDIDLSLIGFSASLAALRQ